MKIAVIGGGPGGMMASGVAASCGAEVCLIEKNEKLGKKLFITGKGRCNVTNDIMPNDFLEKVVTNKKFLFSSIYKFTPSDCMQFFTDHGVELKTERGGRVFPASDKSSDIIKALEKFVRKNNVDVWLNTKVISIAISDNGFVIKTDKGQLKCDKVIVATGGCSYTATGSTGDGYDFARQLGHKVSTILPALVPIDLVKFNSELAGISLKNVKAIIKLGEKTFSEFGEMLFTHTGVSGPIVLSLSSQINKLKLDNAKFVIDLKPALDETQLDNRLVRDFENYKNKNFANYLPNLLPKGLIEEFLKRLDFSGDKKINNITRQDRQKVIHILKNFDFDIKCLKPVEFGIVTSGGVDVAEVNAATMQSKLVDGLYFVGEVLDVDALTGGYNIQIALSTGYLAGVSSTKEI